VLLRDAGVCNVDVDFANETEVAAFVVAVADTLASAAGERDVCGVGDECAEEIVGVCVAAVSKTPTRPATTTATHDMTATRSTLTTTTRTVGPATAEAVSTTSTATTPTATATVTAVTSTKRPLDPVTTANPETATEAESTASTTAPPVIVINVTTTPVESTATATVATVVTLTVLSTGEAKKGATKVETSQDARATFSIGDVLVLSPDTKRVEYNVVVDFGSIIFQYPLKHTHPAGSTIAALSKEDAANKESILAQLELDYKLYVENQATSKDDKALSGGGVAGIVIAVMFALIIVVYVVIFVKRSPEAQGSAVYKVATNPADEEAPFDAVLTQAKMERKDSWVDVGSAATFEARTQLGNGNDTASGVGASDSWADVDSEVEPDSDPTVSALVQHGHSGGGGMKKSASGSALDKYRFNGDVQARDGGGGGGMKKTASGSALDKYRFQDDNQVRGFVNQVRGFVNPEYAPISPTTDDVTLDAAVSGWDEPAVGLLPGTLKRREEGDDESVAIRLVRAKMHEGKIDQVSVLPAKTLCDRDRACAAAAAAAATCLLFWLVCSFIFIGRSQSWQVDNCEVYELETCGLQNEFEHIRAVMLRANALAPPNDEELKTVAITEV
jgi:hypothetical protein